MKINGVALESAYSLEFMQIECSLHPSTRTASFTTKVLPKKSITLPKSGFFSGYATFTNSRCLAHVLNRALLDEARVVAVFHCFLEMTEPFDSIELLNGELSFVRYQWRMLLFSPSSLHSLRE